MQAESTRRYKDMIRRLDEGHEPISDHISNGIDGLLVYLAHIVEETVYRGVTQALTARDQHGHG